MNASQIVPPPTPARRLPLRLSLVETRGREQLDGGWWPQSRDLTVELAELVNEFPIEAGRVVRVVYSPPDWDVVARRIPVQGGSIGAGFFPRDDTHVVDVKTSDGRRLRLLVVPTTYTGSQGAEALLAASTPGNSHVATAVLDRVTDQREGDPREVWADDGTMWWGADGAPSYRTRESQSRGTKSRETKTRATKKDTVDE